MRRPSKAELLRSTLASVHQATTDRTSKTDLLEYEGEVMNVKKIMKKYLEENGFHCLVYPEIECGCRVDDLFPCGSCPDDCQPGYAHPCNCVDGCNEFHFKTYAAETDH